MLKPVSYKTAEGKNRVDSLIHRQFEISSQHEAEVKEILEQVRGKGDQAVVQYTRQYDAPDFEVKNLAVSKQELKAAYSKVNNNFLLSIKKAILHIEEFHMHQRPKSWIMTREDGSVLGQMIRPVDAAGLYVPGGKGGETPLVSSVLMNSIPAKIAGVKRIVITTPPDRYGDVNPYLLVAASEVGVKEIYKIGSAWAIGALAFGTETVPSVDIVVGPGNVYVTLAKKMIAGIVGIDMVAGPSEVLVIADDSAKSEFVAADLLSQAEHDRMATAMMITTSARLVEEVPAVLESQLEKLARRETAIESLKTNGLLLKVDDLETGAGIANRIAPEHLELMVSDPWGLLPKIRHAGAIFMGSATPEPIGDYIAGPNHVLPTMGTARFSSALGVETFMKQTSLISYSREAFQKDADDVIRLAEIEGLTAHAESIRVRQG
ncbi:MAG: histidinol dehydrogenase [delta proteobacterium ML8_D]|nr:MAG: histidinol dehydrogenase [delta proteobacterium ML8_D]